MKYLYAYTPPGYEWPPFINFSECDSGDVRVLIRGDASEGHPGHEASFVIPKKDRQWLANALLGAGHE